MAKEMSLLSVILQEAARRDREARTIWGFLSEQMDDGVDGGGRRRRSLKQRLGFKVMGCCGATWGFRPPAVSVRGGDDDEDDEDDRRVPEAEVINTRRSPEERDMDRSCLSPFSGSSPAPSGMNLATALAAERRLRASPRGADGGLVEPNNNEFDSLAGIAGTGTPLRVSLLRLLEETDGGNGGGGGVAEKKREEAGNDSMCCVCMGRKKGAAFIPCGHTFCRVCSRELWLNRGSCPLCNRSILEILDIF